MTRFTTAEWREIARALTEYADHLAGLAQSWDDLFAATADNLRGDAEAAGNRLRSLQLRKIARLVQEGADE